MASNDSVSMLSDFLHMNSSDQEFSYANNSSVQEYVITKVQSILKETIKEIANLDGFPACFNIADLGCSSGPNILSVISNIIDEIREVCKQKKRKAPQLQICLNDLFGNDFNSIFKSLPMFYAKYNIAKEDNGGRCFISAVPGSFYGRLFITTSMHFFYSSSSLHWLSQVPKGLENNELNIYMAKTSSPTVFELYRKQFQKDFTMFLESRSSEIINGGHMVLTLAGRRTVDPCSNDISILLSLLANSLVDMAAEGLVRESEIHSFNLPMYTPYIDEVTDIIHRQGSFSLDVVESFDVYFDQRDAPMKVSDEPSHGKKVASIIRAGFELTNFGTSAMDMLFSKFAKYVDKYMSPAKTKHFSIVISLTKI
ncbi:benzoate carboxyl methyltransferase-like [Rutidosis leptorrhynchoides]|uniref:benzoate carboxyl methyltransferase-like n=1 Tax=Rutidosis leptorrhynchoides TaxID=125765 RepID=UPI003A99D318